MRKTIITTIIFILISTLISAQEDLKRFKYEAEMAPDSNFYFTNMVGDLVIKGWDRPYISIVAEKNIGSKYIKQYGESLYKEFKIDIKNRGRHFICDTVFPKRDVKVMNTRKEKGDKGFSVDYEIMLPKNCSVYIKRLVAGAVTMENMSGRINVGVIQGSFKANNIAGRIEVNLSMGKVTLSDVSGDISVHGSHCKVNLENITGSLDVSTTAGDIDIHAIDLESANINTTSADVDMVVDSPLTFGRYKITALSGDVDLTIDKSSAFEIYAKTTDGSIKTAFDFKVIKERRKSYILGEYNQGGAEITINSFQGDIRINH